MYLRADHLPRPGAANMHGMTANTLRTMAIAALAAFMGALAGVVLIPVLFS
jgi:hypothetical protein